MLDEEEQRKIAAQTKIDYEKKIMERIVIDSGGQQD